MDHQDRWEQIRRLPHDSELKLPDRVAGLLVLLYGLVQSAVTVDAAVTRR